MTSDGHSTGIRQYGVRLAGVGHCVPERRLTNRDFEQMFDTTDEWIVTRTGMRERRISDPEQPVSVLGIGAARDALERANLTAEDIDCFIVATVTPDYVFPATACLIAAELGVAGRAGFDMEIGCSGFVYGLTIGSSLVRTGAFRRVMLIGAEKLSSLVNWEDRGTAILFGDGAGAAILERSEIDSFLGSSLGSDGSNPEVLYLPAGGSRERITAEGIDQKRDKVRMRGREVFKFAVQKMAESATEALAQAGLTPRDVKWLIPHQANRRIIEAAAKVLEVPLEHVVINVANYGNTSSASIPIALSEALANNAFEPGDVLLFTAFGAGLSWGSVAWKWTGARA
jgi:3-oxoacyl-[acyl-carrier-protein] synthase-3